MSNSIDAVSHSLDKHLAEEMAYDLWYDRELPDLIEGFFEKTGLEPDEDLKRWEKYVAGRWEAHCG